MDAYIGDIYFFDKLNYLRVCRLDMGIYFFQSIDGLRRVYDDGGFDNLYVGNVAEGKSR